MSLNGMEAGLGADVLVASDYKTTTLSGVTPEANAVMMSSSGSGSSGGGTAPTSGPVYTLAADAFGTHPAGDYLIINDSGTFKGYSVTGGQSNPVIGSTAITFTTMDQTDL